jgi:hypothetical protein
MLDIGAKRFVVIGKPLRLHVDWKTEMRHSSTRERSAADHVESKW